MIMMLGRAWGDLITYWINLYMDRSNTLFTEIFEPHLSLIIESVICIILFFLVLRVLKKSRNSASIAQVDADYCTFLTIGTGTILLCYYGLIIIPMAFNIADLGIIQM